MSDKGFYKIECIRYKSFEKGSLRGFTDLYVGAWDFEIKGCSVFMKDGKRWVNFPSQEFTTTDGEQAYASVNKFREKENMNKFTEEAKKAIDEFCSNPKEYDFPNVETGLEFNSYSERN